MSDFPLMLYRHGSEFVWDGRPVDSIIVDDSDEEKAAAKEGWVRSYEELVAAKPKAEIEDQRPMLRAEYEKLAGKKAFGGWSAEALSEKIEALKADK
jgi:hypothetical protein